MPDLPTLITLACAALTLLVVLFIAARVFGQSNDVARRVDAVGRDLGQQVGAAATETAERLERVRGDLRQELSDRIHTGLQAVRAGVEQQLNAGRLEQENRLRVTVAQLEAKFDTLSTRTGQGLTEARTELTRTLGEATKRLEEKFTALEQRTTSNLDTIRNKMDERLAVIGEQVQKKLDENIKEGFAHFERVQSHLKAAEEQLRNVGALGSSINDLNMLLKLPHLRGRFGEASLERLLTDFLPAHMFEFQHSATDDGRSRPDAIIRFPDRVLPIDSKFPREAVLPLFERSDPAVLDTARVELARVVREQAASIARYIEPERGTTDVALMYLPSETLWYEVVQNHELGEQLARLRVFPVSPNTLLVTLHAISLTHKWYQVAAGFEKTARELQLAQKHFGNFERRFEELGKSLQKAQDAYGTAVTHLGKYQSRIARLTGEPPSASDAEPALLTDAPDPAPLAEAPHPALPSRSE